MALARTKLVKFLALAYLESYAESFSKMQTLGSLKSVRGATVDALMPHSNSSVGLALRNGVLPAFYIGGLFEWHTVVFSVFLRLSLHLKGAGYRILVSSGCQCTRLAVP